MTATMQKSVRRASGAAVGVAIAMLLLPGSRSMAQTGCVPEGFTASTVNMGEDAVVVAASVEIQIARWSTEREKDRFARVLLDHGASALLNGLRDTDRVGQIRLSNGPALDLQFAWQELDDSGRRIILITDRPTVVSNEAMRLRAVDDLFTVIEIRLSADGEGEGKAAIASKSRVNRSLDLIEVADYDIEPVWLTGVRATRRTS